MNYPTLYRKRIMPDECVYLKDDVILKCNEDIILTKCKAPKRPSSRLFLLFSERRAEIKQILP